MTHESFHDDEILGLRPKLFAFARSLGCDPVRAEDLVQETLLKAYAYRASYEAGTNLRAWTFKIMRNIHYTIQRRKRFEIEDPDGVYAAAQGRPPDQEDRTIILHLDRALSRMPHEQREAIILVLVEANAYATAASILQVPVGTIRSRVSRGRRTLSRLLDQPYGG